MELQGRRVVVVGLARSGRAAASFLAARGARVVATDSQPAGSLGDLGPFVERGVALELGGHRAETFRTTDLIVVSPGVPPAIAPLEVARAAGVEIISEIELAFRFLKGSIIAVTGTKGKSTTTTLIGRMLAEAGRPVGVGGNIGLPLIEQVEHSTPDTVHVVEVSSFQLEMTDTFRPHVAVLLNLSPDHLDRHADFAAYVAAKARIFRNQTAEDFAVINADDPVALRAAARVRGRQVLFALDTPLAFGYTLAGDWIVDRRAGADTPLVPVTGIRLRGRHLLGDVVAACAAASLVGAPPEAIQRAARAFRGLEHALEEVATIDGVLFVNDSKATNIEAARHAILSFEPPVAVILGGRFKGGNFGDLAEPLKTRQATVIAIGEARPLVARALGSVVPVLEAGSMREAIREAYRAVAPAGTVLLAPACASFDLFADYAQRGRVFKEEVRLLERECHGS